MNRSDDSTPHRYQLSLHAIDLPNKGGLFRVSSPYAKVKIISGPQRGTELGETEASERNLSPDWCKIFFLEFAASEVTQIEVTIWDNRDNKEPIWMGEGRFEATSVYQEAGNTKSQQVGRADTSRLFCHIERSRLGTASGNLRFHLRGLDVKNVEPGAFGLGRSDPFFELAKKNADYSIAQVKWNVVYRSEYIDNNLNPYWRPTTIGLEELCYGKIDWPLKVTVLDHNDNGYHRVIGEFETTIDELRKRVAIKGNADREQAIPISREGKFKTYGLLCVLQAELQDEGEV